MSEIVKVCLRHGELKEDQVHKEKSKSKKGFQLRCNQCKLEKDRRWKNLNREKHRASAGTARSKARKLYREGLIDEEPKANIWRRQDRLDDPGKYLEKEAEIRKRQGQMRNIQEICRRRGITRNRYFEMLENQNHKCAICNEKEKRMSRKGDRVTALAIDHCHTTNKVRALLCAECNSAIGKFKDNVELMQKAIQYIKDHE